MGSHSCCCSQNVGLLRGLCLGEYSSSSSCRRVAGRHDLKNSFTGNFTKEQNAGGAAGISCADLGGKCGVIRCHCLISAIDQQGYCNANCGGGGGFHRRRGNEAFLAGIGMEGSMSQAVRQRAEKKRTHSVGLMRDYSILESSSCKGCTGSKTPSGFVSVASSSSSKGDDYDKDMNRNLSKMKLSVRTLAIAACFGGIGGIVTVLLSTLPPDFESRWRKLLDDALQGEGPSQGGPQSPTVLFDRHGVVIATIAPGGYSHKQDDNLPGSSGNAMSVSLAEIPSWMWQAVVASEDRRFFKHKGVDPRGFSRAVLSLATRGGGSTITQQLIKNVVLTNERKWPRKLSEILLALVLEKQMSKWDILHRYLKKIYWGHGVYGIEGASALYFGKHPSLLTLGECAMLAGIIPAPELLSPYRDPSRGKRPQGRALRRMVEAGYLDTASAVEALRQPLKLASESNEGIAGPWRAPYFVSEVLSELTRKYGWSKVACGGLQVYTTLDLSMQTVAEKVVLDHLVEYDKERILLSDEGLRKSQERLKALQVERQKQIAKVVKGGIKSTEEQSGNFINLSEGNELAAQAAKCKTRTDFRDIVSSPAARKAAAAVVKRFWVAEEYLKATASKYKEEIKAAEESRMEGAMVAIDPLSGAVRVLVGGRDYYESNFNRGTQAFRSPGSTFKPVVYLTALAEGLERDHVLKDEPLTIEGFPPENYDGDFCGKVTLEESLVYSLNTPTVRLCAEVGVDKVCAMGRALGIETFLPNELTLSLGGCKVTPMQLATVYATIAAGGVYHKPHFITRIVTQEGQILEEHKPSKSGKQVPIVNEIAVVELRRLLQAVVEKGTGRAARLGRSCAGQTGTSNEHKDVCQQRSVVGTSITGPFSGVEQAVDRHIQGFSWQVFLSSLVWLGYDDNAPVGGLHPATGASHAAPLWKEFMKNVHERAPVRKFHDMGSEKYGSRAPKRFVKRSRRTPRIGLHETRTNLLKKKENIPWKQVWDWEEASVAWKELEKMDDWVAHRMRRTTRTIDWAGLPRPL